MESKSKHLNSEDLKVLKNALEAVKENEAEINLAISAGVDMGDALKRNREEMARIRKLINTYWPGQA